MHQTLRALRLASCALLLSASAHADVVRLVVEKREAFANQGRAYEKLTGRFFGELDAKHPLNAIITDVEHAPRNARGLVEYSATFTILKPVDMTGATGILVYQVPNRGRANIEGGGYFSDFRARGHVLVASGWQADIQPGPGIETMVTPVAKASDQNKVAILATDASRRAALLIAQIRPVFSLFAPCRAGASAPKLTTLF